jgi:hypothetical protein
MVESNYYGERDTNSRLRRTKQQPATHIARSTGQPTEDHDWRRDCRSVLLVVLVLAVIFLLNPSTPTEKIRDVFIIFMALESLVLGVALVILIVQLARLINLLQNELKPIIGSTNEL